MTLKQRCRFVNNIRYLIRRCSYYIYMTYNTKILKLQNQFKMLIIFIIVYNFNDLIFFNIIKPNFNGNINDIYLSNIISFFYRHFILYNKLQLYFQKSKLMSNKNFIPNIIFIHPFVNWYFESYI